MKTALIHAGMPKTGSSAIQEAIRGLDRNGVRAVRWRSPNQSGLVALLFMEPVEEFRAFRANGRSRAELMAERATWQQNLREDLSEPEVELPVLSGEIIASLDHDALARMRDFWHACDRAPRIVAYVRSPVSFISSAFQQILKTPNLDRLSNIGSFWPHYRKRFETFDTVFGRENVELRLFERGHLESGSVVQDFGRMLGVALPEPQGVNETMSVEAASLLYVQRIMGQGMPRGYPTALRENQAFYEAVMRIGTGKFAFGPAITDPILAANAEDLAWIDARMGVDMMEIERASARRVERPIDDLSDFAAIATEVLPRLEALLAERMHRSEPIVMKPGGPAARERRARAAADRPLPVLRALEALRLLEGGRFEPPFEAAEQ